VVNSVIVTHWVSPQGLNKCRSNKSNQSENPFE